MSVPVYDNVKFHFISFVLSASGRTLYSGFYSREIKEKKANQLWPLLFSLILECSILRNSSAFCVQL